MSITLYETDLNSDIGLSVEGDNRKGVRWRAAIKAGRRGLEGEKSDMLKKEN